MIISQYFYPENFRINDVVRLLLYHGCDVVVLTGCPNYPDGVPFDGYSGHTLKSELHPDGFLIYRVPIITRGNAATLRLFLNYISFVLSAIFFGSYVLRNHKYDLIFVYAPSPIFQAVIGIFFKYLRGVPLITWVQDLWPECIELTGHVKNKWFLYLVSAAVSWTYKRHDLLLTQSRSFISSVKKRAGFVPVEYFPNPGDDVLNRGNLNLPPTTDHIFLKFGFNIVFAGNLGTVQSLPMILDAAAILRDYSNIRIILVGSGSLSQWLHNEIKSRQIGNVILAGRYPAESMQIIFDHASALLVSLNTDPILNQTVPAKLQSYLAAGKPIIASLDGEGAQIVVDANAGITCRTEDPVALAHAIVKLSNMSQDQLGDMGAAGKRYFAQNYEPKILVKKLITIFMETIVKASTRVTNEK